MTSYSEVDVTCSVCGCKSVRHRLASISSFGSPDLDLRPPEMKRSAMMSTLEECTNCGYVSAALEEHEAGVSEGVISAARSSVDSQQLEHMLIGPCIVRSKLDESLGNLALAAEYALWAAWAADDDNTQDAKPYRYKAAELFARAAASLPSESESALVMKARLIDVFRRAEKWNDAIKLANNLFASDGLSPIMLQVVTFSRKMAVERSSRRFTVQEAVADS